MRVCPNIVNADNPFFLGVDALDQDRVQALTVWTCYSSFPCQAPPLCHGPCRSLRTLATISCHSRVFRPQKASSTSVHNLKSVSGLYFICPPLSSTIFSSAPTLPSLTSILERCSMGSVGRAQFASDTRRHLSPCR